MTNSQNPTDAMDLVPTPEDSSFGDILSQFEQQHVSKGSEAPIDGTVVSVTDEMVLVDIGRKHEGSLTLEQVRDSAGNITLKAGDKINVTVSGRDGGGYYTLSTIRVVVPKDWSGLEQAFADQSVITGVVEEVIKGGLKVDVGVRAFMPASRSGERDQAGMEKLVGQQIECRITKLDTAKEDVVVDRRGILEERAAVAKTAAFDTLVEGSDVDGTVRNVMDFGAFVDVGGMDGLLHVAEMSWIRNAKPSDIVKPGDSVRVRILKINRETRKISLGMKQLIPDPWSAAVQSIKQGDRVKGKVTRVTDFGAFVELQPGVEGLVHISEMSWSKKQLKPSQIVKPGELVDAVVLSVNLEEKRIGLGLKQLLGDPWDGAVRKYPVGATVEAANVISLQPFGAFVDLGDGIEGMIHIGDITREKRLEHPKEMLTVGTPVRAQVVEVDNQRRRIRLSMKQLEPTSADEYIAEHTVGEMVTGRIVDVGKGRAKVELAEGVTAVCKLPEVAESKPAEEKSSAAKADLGSLSAMLEAKWKKGGSGPSESPVSSIRVGQILQFKISALDAAARRVDVEL